MKDKLWLAALLIASLGSWASSSSARTNDGDAASPSQCVAPERPSQYWLLHPLSVYFHPGDTEITPWGDDVISAVADLSSLAAPPQIPVIISYAASETELDLSRRRAEKVSELLKTKGTASTICANHNIPTDDPFGGNRTDVLDARTPIKDDPFIGDRVDILIYSPLTD